MTVGAGRIRPCSQPPCWSRSAGSSTSSSWARRPPTSSATPCSASAWPPASPCSAWGSAPCWRAGFTVLRQPSSRSRPSPSSAGVPRSSCSAGSWRSTTSGRSSPRCSSRWCCFLSWASCAAPTWWARSMSRWPWWCSVWSMPRVESSRRARPRRWRWWGCTAGRAVWSGASTAGSTEIPLSTTSRPRTRRSS